MYGNHVMNESLVNYLKDNIIIYKENFDYFESKLFTNENVFCIFGDKNIGKRVTIKNTLSDLFNKTTVISLDKLVLNEKLSVFNELNKTKASDLTDDHLIIIENTELISNFGVSLNVILKFIELFKKGNSNSYLIFILNTDTTNLPYVFIEEINKCHTPFFVCNPSSNNRVDYFMDKLEKWKLLCNDNMKMKASIDLSEKDIENFILFSEYSNYLHIDRFCQKIFKDIFIKNNNNSGKNNIYTICGKFLDECYSRKGSNLPSITDHDIISNYKSIFGKYMPHNIGILLRTTEYLSRNANIEKRKFNDDKLNNLKKIKIDK